ncbi:DUF4012 domain-containing protein [Paenarthrobacter sp. DKR-5]|uniref:DUF4012 domain-containing protein n=1 Tax=Paenarthrobacter sp. DKR-5 TaxID=2835535 RepID=UPI001BDCCFB9|nr:DUF4012 domain-containing protein [Paenarthrobacter sp. DKR-5]MBT1004469.1 DUF4012 domain-containing protein [Paenarthrobacter sp. DKR-5]
MSETNNTSPVEGEGGGPARVRVKKRIQPRRRRKILLRIALAVGLVAVLLAAAGFWLGNRAVEIKSDLEASNTLLPELKTQLLANDKAAANKTIASLRDHTSAARSAGTDPVWKAAAALPVIGANFSAGTEATVAADDLVNLAAAPLVRVYDSLDWKALTPAHGAVNLQPFSAAAPSIVSAARTVQLSYERLENIDTSSLLPQVAQPLEKAKSQLADARLALNTAGDAAQLIPAMMGEDGIRNYLLLVQNLAEIRTSGGIPGALAVLQVNHGRIKLGAQSSATALRAFDPPVDVDAQQEQIYTSRLGTYMQDVNMTPDFPTAAQTAKQMWEKRNPRQTIDGVLSIDPVVLGKMLKVTGPVELPSEAGLTGMPTTLTADNVVKTLLSDVYAKVPNPADQDLYFAGVAKKVFDAVSSGKGSGEQLVNALAAGTAEHRVLLWSAHSDEQRLLSGQTIAGSVTGPSVPAAAFGAYFNDGTGAKMDYYVKRRIQLVQGCDAGGYRNFTVKMTLTNTAPADAATSLPRYVTGGGDFGVAPGTVQTNVIAYGPSQANLDTAKVDGKQVPLGSYRHAARPVGTLTVQLSPGESKTVEISFGKVVQTSAPQLAVTPTIQPVNDVVGPLITACTK